MVFTILITFLSTYYYTRCKYTHSTFQHTKKPLTRENMEIVHSDMKTLLQKITMMLNDLGLTWYISAGTLLGYMRKKHFILWDDDIDIRTFNRDHSKLVNYINSLEEKKGDIFYCSKYKLYFKKAGKKDGMWFQVCQKNDFLIHADLVNQNYKGKPWFSEDFVDKTELVSLEGITVSAPFGEQKKEVLDTRYGKDWFIPK